MLNKSALLLLLNQLLRYKIVNMLHQERIFTITSRKFLICNPQPPPSYLHYIPVRTPENLSQQHSFLAVCEPMFVPAALPESGDHAGLPLAAGRRRGRTAPCGPSAWRRMTWLLPLMLCVPPVHLKKETMLLRTEGNPAKAATSEQLTHLSTLH